MIATYKTLKPDAKGRITIGSLVGDKNISSFHAYIDRQSRIILEPFTEIPASELWLYKNRQALASIRRGIRQSAKKQTKSLGSFTKSTPKS